MGFFDLFKKKKTSSTFPENELEKCLVQAVSDYSAQKGFYQKLLWNELFVLTSDHSTLENKNQNSENNTSIRFVIFESGHIPIFTSLNRIFDKGVVKKESPYVSLKGQDLFSATTGSTFILNPYSDHSKELVPEEIENLLNGTIYKKIEEQELEDIKNKEFNEIFERAGKNQEGLISLDGYKTIALKEYEKQKLEDSIKDFKKCLELIPTHWQSMVLMSKALQRLEKHKESFEQLELAFKIELENHIIPMEASLESMHLHDIDKALFYSEESLKRKPDDFALLGNHAMNLLLAQKDQQAKETIEKAIKIQPNDTVNINILSIIKDVMSGKQKRPTFEDTIK